MADNPSDHDNPGALPDPQDPEQVAAMQWAEDELDRKASEDSLERDMALANQHLSMGLPPQANIAGANPMQLTPQGIALDGSIRSQLQREFRALQTRIDEIAEVLELLDSNPDLERVLTVIRNTDRLY